MSLITRVYTFSDGTVAYGSQVDAEIANIVNVLNSLDQGNTTWTNVKLTTLVTTGDLDFSSHRLKNVGTPTTAGDAVVYPITNTVITAQTIRGTSANSSGTAREIGQGTISTPDLRANAITLTSSSDQNTGSLAVNTSITSTSITTVGGKVLIVAVYGVSGDSGTVLGKASAVHAITLDRDGTPLTSTQSYLKMDSTGNTFHLNSSIPIIYIDSPTAGAHTYTLYYQTGGASGVATVDYHLQVVELRA